MKTTKILTVCALVLLLAGWGITPAFGQIDAETQAKLEAAMEAARAADPEHFIPGSLGFIGAADVYKLQCRGASRFACATVCDPGAPDDLYQASVTQTKPASVAAGFGQTGIAQNAPGGCGGICIVRPTAAAGAMTSLVVVSYLPGSVLADGYDLTLDCFGDFPFPVTPHTVTPLQDQ